MKNLKVLFRNNFGTQMTTPSLSIFVNRGEPSVRPSDRTTVCVVLMFFFWDIELWVGDVSEVV